MPNSTDPPEDATLKPLGEPAKPPTAKSARDLVQPSTAKLLRVFAEPPHVNQALTRVLAQFKLRPIDPGMAKALAGIKPIEIDPSIARALAQIRPIKVMPGLAKSISEAEKALADFGKSYGGIAKAISAFEQQNRLFQRSLVASLGGSIGDIARAGQLASTLAKIELPEIAKLYPNHPNVAAEVTRIHDTVLKSITGPIRADQARLSAMLGLRHEFSAILETTRFKMTAFAALTDGIGLQTPALDEAYRSLFGQWRTRPELPENYWSDAGVRRRMYQAAEVDPGLAGTSGKVAVEVAVESGLASGARSDANCIAVIKLGDVSMTIRSNHTRGDSYKVLERFEEDLRAYVTGKLSREFGPDWFKLRVDGNIAGDAKRIRRQALERGEDPVPLINYTELGQLASIVLSRKNWDQVFGDVFINSAEFDFDMLKLIAARRPTMHIRPIDGVRLVELICVVQRLSKQMENDGEWKLLAESER